MEHNERPIHGTTYSQRLYQDDTQDEQSFWSPVQEVLSQTEEQIRLQRSWESAMDVSYSSSPAGENLGKRKRKSDPSEVDEVSVKPYQCRFCPMRFSKSQALGGHMNRHRQEREQEQLTKAQQLIIQKRMSSFDRPDWEISSSTRHQLKMHSSDLNSKYSIARSSTPQHLNGVFPSSSGFSWASSFSGGQTIGNVTDSFQEVGNEHVASLLQARQQSRSCSSLDMNTFALSPQNLTRNPFALIPDGLPYERSMHTSCFPFDENWVDLDPYSMRRSDYPNQRQVVILSPLSEKHPDAIGARAFPDAAAATSFHPFGFLNQTANYQQADGIQSKVPISYGLPLENVHDFFQASKGSEAYPLEGITTVPNSSSLQALFPTTENQLGISSWMLGNQKHEDDEGFSLALGNAKFITDPVSPPKPKTAVPGFYCVEGTAKEPVSSSCLSEDFASSSMLRETSSIAASAPQSHGETSDSGKPRGKEHGEFTARFQ